MSGTFPGYFLLKQLPETSGVGIGPIFLRILLKEMVISK